MAVASQQSGHSRQRPGKTANGGLLLRCGGVVCINQILMQWLRPMSLLLSVKLEDDAQHHCSLFLPTVQSGISLTSVQYAAGREEAERASRDTAAGSFGKPAGSCERFGCRLCCPCRPCRPCHPCDGHWHMTHTGMWDGLCHPGVQRLEKREFRPASQFLLK